MSVLDDATLHLLFSGLPGEALAACAQVCREWRRIAASEMLWQRKCQELEPHPHLRRDDLLPLFSGSHRAYYAWRWPLLRRPVGRILVEGQADEITTLHVAPQLPTAAASDSHDGGGGVAGSGSSKEPKGQAEPWGHQAKAMDVDESPAGPSSGSGAAGAASGRGGSEEGVAGRVFVATEPDTMVQQATWSPAGSLLAFTEVRADRNGLQESRVVVADGRSGARLGSWALGVPLPPFYYQWSCCGTRLLFLSNWQGGVVALRVLDVAPALLSPAQRSRPGSAATQEVLLCTSRPLFLSTSPTSTRLLWHGACRRFGLADAATLTAEDGAEEDCFFENPVGCQSQAPQWLVDSAGTDWLLMPVMRPQAVEGEAGVLVLASLAAVSEALEVEGSRLSPTLLLSLSQQVAPFASARDLSFAASLDASHVAWCDRGTLRIWFRGSGAVHQIFPLPDAAAEVQQQQQQPWRGGGRAPGVGGHWHSGAVQAMQWSPEGRRLLFLVRRSGGGLPMVSLAKRPHYRWMVYDAPATAPPPAVPQPEPSSWLGTLTQCCPFNPTLEFFDRYLPFFDQYSRSMRLWDPSSTAFCFTSRGRPSMWEIRDDPYVSVQPVPRPSQTAGVDSDKSGGSGSAEAAGASEAPGSGGGGGAGAAALPLALQEAPLPVWLVEGTFASWSWL